MTKSNDPKIKPCGTPDLQGSFEEVVPPTTIYQLFMLDFNIS